MKPTLIKARIFECNKWYPCKHRRNMAWTHSLNLVLECSINYIRSTLVSIHQAVVCETSFSKRKDERIPEALFAWRAVLKIRQYGDDNLLWYDALLHVLDTIGWMHLWIYIRSNRVCIGVCFMHINVNIHALATFDNGDGAWHYGLLSAESCLILLNWVRMSNCMNFHIVRAKFSKDSIFVIAVNYSLQVLSLGPPTEFHQCEIALLCIFFLSRSPCLFVRLTLSVNFLRIFLYCIHRDIKPTMQKPSKNHVQPNEIQYRTRRTTKNVNWT